MIEEIRVIVTGQVQGVGFRAYVKRYAVEHHLKGYTRNLQNGSVEICAQGAKGSLLEFVKALEKHPGKEQIEIDWKGVCIVYPSFEILF